MGKNINLVLPLILWLMLILISCAYRPLNYAPINQKKISGDLSKTKSESITIDYEIKVQNGFSASIDFEIKEGKVDWEIVNSIGNIVFAGYVINENGTTYRQLTKPSTYFSGRFNQKEAIINEADFNSLQFEANSPSGIYKLILKPTNSEGNYKVVWSDRLANK